MYSHFQFSEQNEQHLCSYVALKMFAAIGSPRKQTLRSQEGKLADTVQDKRGRSRAGQNPGSPCKPNSVKRKEEAVMDKENLRLQCISDSLIQPSGELQSKECRFQKFPGSSIPPCSVTEPRGAAAGGWQLTALLATERHVVSPANRSCRPPWVPQHLNISAVQSPGVKRSGDTISQLHKKIC